MGRIGFNSIVILMSVVMAFAFSSCDLVNGNKSKVVGHWRYSETNSVDTDEGEVEFSYTGVTSYNSDGSSHDSGTFTFVIKDSDEDSDSYGLEVTMTYSIKSYGTFNVSGTTLTENVSDVNISFKSAKTNLSDLYSDVVKGGVKDIEKELIKSFRDEREEALIKSFKNIIYGSTTYEIVTVNDTKMVLKSVDEDGESDVTEYERLYEVR